MALSLYNTYTKRKEEFQPLEPGVVRMYNCGPTVYSYAHIGNFRSFVFADLLRRYLEFRGLKVRQVMNITDVGHLTEDTIDQGMDKLEKAAQAENMTPEAIARKFEEAFHGDRKLLNLLEAEAYPRATDYVPKMIDMVSTLVDKGFAYEVDGEVYFDISRFPKYGALSGNSVEDLVAGARVAVNDKKRSPVDFALWKHDSKHLMQWSSPWSEGFPGWHIECSAMSTDLLGETIDIHTGGEDNVFPHHEAEIAQTEAATGKPFVRTWCHVRHLLVDGRKMAKSEGNFYTIRDIMDRGYKGHELRYVYVSANYRQPLNFTFESLEAARKSVNRLAGFVESLRERKGEGSSPEMDQLCREAEGRFTEAMDDDLNVSEALAAIFDFVRAVNRIDPSGEDAEKALKLMSRFDDVFAILPPEREARDEDAEIDALVKQRQAARKARDFAEADRIRAILDERGIVVKDTPEGPKWSRRD